MNLKTKVLDHGFVTLRNLAGPTRRATGLDHNDHTTIRMFDADDRDPAQAARMSFDDMDEEIRTEEEDFRLSRYLMKNWHTSPFEMIECWFEMKMPIFVARQFVRHRTAMLNEVSGRYVTLPAEWYIPEIVGGKPVNAKQGQSDNLPGEVQEWFKAILDADCAASYQRYTYAIEKGVAAEHARMFLHLNHYTHWLWKQNLHNQMHFLRLRDHGHAQIEAQAYAKAVDAWLRMFLPKTMELYDEYRRMQEPADLDALLAEFDKRFAASYDTASHNGSYGGQREAASGMELLKEIKAKLREAGL
jgi:thymidylate synthase (FAD)